MSNKKWVFNQLVKDKGDFPGLLAYALYKHSKSDLAHKLRTEDKLSEDLIQDRLEQFHDNTLKCQLDDYREKANKLLKNLSEITTKDIKAQHAREVKKLSKSYFDQFEEFKSRTLPFDVKLFLWLKSGVLSLLSSIFVSMVLIFIASFFITENQYKSMIINLLQSIPGVPNL